MQEQLDLIERVYGLVINFVVEYSFQLLGAVIIMAVGFVVARSAASFLERLQERRNVDVTLRQFIASTTRLFILVMFAVVALSELGISITPLIAAIGGLAVGVSLAIQGPVSNYGAGLVVILTRMYRVGDTVSLRGHSGQVEDISLALTRLRAEDGEEVIIPNKHVVGEIYRNSGSHRIVEGRIGVSYDSDLERATQLISDTLSQREHVVLNPAPEVGIAAFGDSAVEIEYRYWVNTGQYFRASYDANLAIFQNLKTNGVDMPYPRRDVRLLADSPNTLLDAGPGTNA